jgi:hypothetical protein
VTLEAVMHEVNQDDRPVSKKTGRPLTQAQINYRNRGLGRWNTGYYDPILGRRVEFDEQ